ncbi:hypothetical protein [Fibrella aquatilis]|uniref:Uncharacterized protein n=1 Tax=Fibrella aquatilis TaxID=2817059 RepID=A0A939JYW7_9BACT|nr:hypothetical protein [Fibrella aquatilis]MBO0934432.1 hypothetical protein [Fibrella aquatilis]
MVRQLLTYTLIVSLLLQLFSREVIVMSFQLNRDYIAKTLCENRSRPALRCNGKCYLAKRLKARQAHEDQETTERVQNLPVIALFCTDLFSFAFANPVGDATSCLPVSYCQQWSYAAPLHGIFQPPRIR